MKANAGIIYEFECACKSLVKQGINEHEAQCIALAHTLKTKLYLMGETSFEWSQTGKAAFDHEMKLVNM